MAIAKRKKKFFDVEMPIIGKETQMQAYEIEELNGRFLKYDLTRLLKGKSIMLTLKVNVDGEVAVATPKKMLVLPYFIRRMMRKGTNYVEDSFDAECEDAKLRIKPFLITRRNYVKDKTSERLFDEILKNQIQKPLSQRLKKIYPLALCEIRAFESRDK